jgi:hypothetical protein
LPAAALRALIRNGDRAAVLQALSAAEIADVDPKDPSRGNPWRLRALYSAFTDLDPATDLHASSIGLSI